MTTAEDRLDRAILAHEQAAAEVERLCDILERAVDALANARRTKRDARKELDRAAAAARSPPQSVVLGATYEAGPSPAYGREEEGSGEEDEDDGEDSDYRSEDGETSSEDGEPEEEDEDEDEDEDDDDEDEEGEDDGFDMGNETLEQIRYRLETSKIDPNSPEGTALLDKLLIRLQGSLPHAVVDADLINELIDTFLFETEEHEAATPRNDGPPLPEGHAEIRINRGGKVLGYYRGELDERGYARQGAGAMYYDAGHTCRGTWLNDEMTGRGVYEWSDGHVYDGEWLNGKRHGLGRFVRRE